MNDERLPPQARDAERAVLGCILRDNAIVDQLGSILRYDDFYVFANQLLFRAALELRAAGKPVDYIQLPAWLEARKHCDDVPASYLVDLWNERPGSIGNALADAELIRDRSLRRKLILTATEIATSAWDLGTPADELAADAAKKNLSLATMGVTASTITAAEAVNWFLQDLDRRQNAGEDSERNVVIPTGWRDLDNLIVGLHPGRLTVVAARTSIGKSIFVCNVASRVAARGLTVFFGSLEMSAVELVERMVAELGRVNSWKLQHNKLDRADRESVLAAAAKISGMPIHIDQSAGQTMNRIVANARRHRSQNNLGLIIVDYLQIIDTPDRRRNEMRQEEVARITRHLKQLAKELQVPVLVPAQLNRDADARAPKLSDLRESGAIEQDSDCVLLLSKDVDQEKDQNRLEDLLTVNVAKNRNGPTGIVTLVHHRPYFAIEDYEPTPSSYAGFTK